MKKFGNICLWFVATVALSACTVFVLNYLLPGTNDRLFSQVRATLEKNYYIPVDNAKLENYALKGMTAALNDKYTNYYTKEEWDLLKQSSSSEYSGIGVTLSVKNDVIKIVEVNKGGPAEKAGIKANDIIAVANGQKVNANSVSSLALTIQKAYKDKKTVKLQILRGKQSLTFDVPVEQLVKQDVVSKQFGDVGYLRIVEFDVGVSDQFKSELSKLTPRSKGLILDLRDNPGGDMDELVKIADSLLPKATIVYLQKRDGTKQYYYSDANYVKMPIVVLVNGKSASAAEVLSGALQDNKRAKVVGTKTFGKGIAQDLIDLPNGGGLYYTFARWYTPSGRCIHKIGIKPDVVVRPLPKFEEASVSKIPFANDAQLLWVLANNFK